MAKISESKDTKPILSKIIVEIRFRPNLTYFSEAFKIASAFEADFDDWQTSHNPYQATLYSEKKNEILRISSDSIAIIYEAGFNAESLKKRLDKVLQLLFIPNNLEEVRRIGVRQILAVQVDKDFDDLAEKFASSFTKDFKKHEALSIDIVGDYQFVLDGIKNGFKNHIRFGPVTPDEAIGRFNPTFGKSSNPVKQNSIYLDTDIYNDEIGSVVELETNTSNIIEESLRITNGYKNLIVSEIGR